jgi:hypothetical protein
MDSGHGIRALHSGHEYLPEDLVHILAMQWRQREWEQEEETIGG